MAKKKASGTVGKGGVNPAPVTDDTTVRVAAEQLVMMPIDELIPYANNARVHSAEQIRQLRGSLREFGFVMPVLVDFDGNIIAGHGRILAAREEGMTEVPCVMVSNLSEAQRKAYILADNRLCERGSWDEDLLRVEIEGLRGMDFDFQLTGFTMDDVADLFSEGHAEETKQTENSADESEVNECRHKCGDVFKIEDQLIKCCGCGGSKNESAESVKE